jgi:hypothetical protein
MAKIKGFYQFSFDGAASIELWYSLQIVPAATGHTRRYLQMGLDNSTPISITNEAARNPPKQNEFLNSDCP